MFWAFVVSALPAGADGPDDPEGGREAPVEFKATQVGIRFTPKMARLISTKMLGEMKGRYDLDEKQAAAIEEIISSQFMEFATSNARVGRDLIEKMIETRIEHGDDGFPKEDAQEFGKLAAPLMPALKGFFLKTSGKIAKEMTLKQRFKFTAEMTAATAGLVIFENRMKRWEEGKVGDGANPFWDPADKDPDETESGPIDPDESSEHRRARVSAERTVQWQTNVEESWKNYLDRAIEYYDFDESQQTGAETILQDCLERARRIKTDDWRAALKKNRLVQRLGRRLGAKISRGPWMFAIDAEYEKLRKPLTDLEKEFKRRIEGLPTSTQRATAKSTVRRLLNERKKKEY